MVYGTVLRVAVPLQVGLVCRVGPRQRSPMIPNPALSCWGRRIPPGALHGFAQVPSPVAMTYQRGGQQAQPPSSKILHHRYGSSVEHDVTLGRWV